MVRLGTSDTFDRFTSFYQKCSAMCQASVVGHWCNLPVQRAKTCCLACWALPLVYIGLQPFAISCMSLSGCWLLLITVGTLVLQPRCPNKSPMALLLAHEMATYLLEGLNLCLHHLDSSCTSQIHCIHFVSYSALL